MSEQIVHNTDINNSSDNRQKWAGLITVSGLETMRPFDPSVITRLDESIVARTPHEQVISSETTYPGGDFLQSAFVFDAIIRGEDHYARQVFGLMSRVLIQALDKDFDTKLDSLQLERARVCRFIELGPEDQLPIAIVNSHSNRISSDHARLLFEHSVADYQLRATVPVVAA